MHWDWRETRTVGNVHRKVSFVDDGYVYVVISAGHLQGQKVRIDRVCSTETHPCADGEPIVVRAALACLVVGQRSSVVHKVVLRGPVAGGSVRDDASDSIKIALRIVDIIQTAQYFEMLD